MISTRFQHLLCAAVLVLVSALATSSSNVPACHPIACSRHCKSGFVYDHGCKTCVCKDPCEHAGLVCKDTERCDLSLGDCDPPPCVPYLQCIPKCGPVCLKYCQYGNVVDKHGCPTCECIDPCKDEQCDFPKICVVDQAYNCVNPPCPATGICKKCPIASFCKIFCPYGQEKDKDGCPTCKCIGFDFDD